MLEVDGIRCAPSMEAVSSDNVRTQRIIGDLVGSKGAAFGQRRRWDCVWGWIREGAGDRLRGGTGVILYDFIGRKCW